ncbi:DUF370 domain-containing protein [bacterium]|nr:DUF370 domain-containing protein [bacterium]
MIADQSDLSVVDVGFGNIIPSRRIVGIVAYDSDPMRRHCQELEKKLRLIDATRGRKVRSVVILDSEQVVLSNVNRETLAERFQTAVGKSPQI